MTEQNKRQEHLGELSRDFAVFLPAISNFYNTFISKQRVTKGAHIPIDRIPKGFDSGVEGLNFINPAEGYLKLAVNADFSKNHPKAYKVMKKMNFTTSDIDKMANYKDTDGLEVSAAAQKWLDEHKSKWSSWVK